MNKIILFLLCIMCGCVRPTTTQPTTRPSTTQSTFDITVKARVIIITKDGCDWWRQSMINDRIEHLRAAFETVGIEWSIISIDRFEKPEWYDVRSLEILNAMQIESFNKSKQGELIFWMVNALSYDGTSVGGLAYLPYTTKESGHGIWCSVFSYTNVMAHEAGHSFGLNHSWINDGCSDTPETTVKEFCTTSPDAHCITMSYCAPAEPYGPCYDKTFTNCEKQLVRKYALIPPRLEVVNTKIRVNRSSRVQEQKPKIAVCNP